MPELFLLIAFMTATLVTMVGLVVIFRIWMNEKDSQMESGGQGGGSH